MIRRESSEGAKSLDKSLTLPLVKQFRVILSTLLCCSSSGSFDTDTVHDVKGHSLDVQEDYHWVCFNELFDVISSGNTLAYLRKSIHPEDMLYILLKKQIHVYLLRWQGNRAPTKLKASFSTSDQDVKHFFNVGLCFFCFLPLNILNQKANANFFL